MFQEYIVEEGAMKVALHRRTMFDVNIYRQFLLASSVVLDTMQGEFQSPPDAIAAAYAGYIQVSAMVHDTQGLPFEYLRYDDTPETIVAKFRVYAEQSVGVIGFVDKVALKALEIMRPANPAIAPGVTGEKKDTGKTVASSAPPSASTPPGKSRRRSRNTGGTGTTKSTLTSSAL